MCSSRVTEPELTIAVASANLPVWFGVAAADSIGRTFGDVVGSGAQRDVAAACGLDWEQRYDELELVTPIGELLASLHRSGPYLIVELERFDPHAPHTGTIAPRGCDGAPRQPQRAAGRGRGSALDPGALRVRPRDGVPLRPRSGTAR